MTYGRNYYKKKKKKTVMTGVDQASVVLTVSVEAMDTKTQEKYVIFT